LIRSVIAYNTKSMVQPPIKPSPTCHRSSSVLPRGPPCGQISFELRTEAWPPSRRHSRSASPTAQPPVPVPHYHQNPPAKPSFGRSLTYRTPPQDEMDRRSKKKKLKSSTRSKREIADFRRTYHQERWDITYCGVPEGDRSAEPSINTCAAVINDNNNLEFAGAALSGPCAAWGLTAG
jgi:hypothetical protein